VRVHEVQSFGLDVLIWGAVGIAALLGHRLARLVRVPAPAIFLLVAAVLASEIKPVRDAVDLHTVVNLVTVALVVILFDGGLHLGRRRFRAAATPIVLLGVFGTFATTALIGLAAHGIFGLEWKVAFVLGAALAPTDPAVVFAVLANKEIAGRTSAILEGESGFNDPAGIALLLGFVQIATHANSSLLNVFVSFAVEMSVGAAIGVVGGLAMKWLLSNREPLMASQQPIRALASVLFIYGVATIAHGSGFLAVLIAGIVMGDEERRHGPAVERFHSTLANLGEIVAFVLLGLSIRLHSLGAEWAWLIGIGLAVLIAFVLRPVACLPLLARADLHRREKAFIAWVGLKGAVPILLGALAVTGGVPDATRLYAIVFVVVAISVVAQGGSLAFVARKLGIEMHEAGTT
jgi:cell volume regulation protein A